MKWLHRGCLRWRSDSVTSFGRKDGERLDCEAGQGMEGIEEAGSVLPAIHQWR